MLNVKSSMFNDNNHEYWEFTLQGFIKSKAKV